VSGAAARRLTVAFAIATAIPAAAQPACPECARGDALIDKMSLQPLRALAGHLAGLVLADPLPAEQYAHLVELRRRTPVLSRLGALDDAELAAVAASLCGSGGDACTGATTRALRCLADRCAIDFPAERAPLDAVEPSEACRRSQHPSTPLGLGVDWATGWHRSRYPNDGRAWSLGIEARLRIARRFGAVARVDRIYGQGAAIDLDGDARADTKTPPITRVAALAGPSVVFDIGRFEDALRFVRFDLLAGYLATTSQPGESGPAAGFDIAYQLSIIRFGFRFVQGFGDAAGAKLVLAHFGYVGGSTPIPADEADCRARSSRSSRSRLALGFDFPLGGFGFAPELGYLAPGLAVEALWHLSKTFDALTRADLLIFPGLDHQRVLHQAVLAGLRIDRGSGRRTHTGFTATIAGGYSQGATLVPTKVGSGPIADLSVGWGASHREAAGTLRLHARFGVAPDNVAYRAIFLSAGFELRLDPDSWRDRD
jgi:hypothetical protein